MATKTDVTAPTDEPAATPTTTHIIEPRAQDATHEAAQETTQEVAQEATITATHPHPPGNALGEGPIFDKRLFRHLVSYMIRGFFAKRQRDVGSTRASVELNAYEALETATKEFAIGYFRWKSICAAQAYTGSGSSGGGQESRGAR
ncbi:hypothetical protein OQA88_8401 [Cercophora sp. LCS_1]